MKGAIILLWVFSLLLVGCKEIKKEIPSETEIATETMDHKEHAKILHERNDTWVNHIVLNNGIKWQANKETTDGLMTMLSLMKEAKIATTADYVHLANGLNEIKNTVVKECTMKGSSHDNLHIWLYPLIEKIELLQKVETDAEGSATTTNIKKQLEGYYS